jgi:hypothetical protein
MIVNKEGRKEGIALILSLSNTAQVQRGASAYLTSTVRRSFTYVRAAVVDECQFVKSHSSHLSQILVIINKQSSAVLMSCSLSLLCVVCTGTV